TASFMNDAVVSDDGYLYVTDSNKDAIYKVSLEDGTHTVFENTIASPNGILLDKSNNRLIVCTWGSNAGIYGVSLSDASVSTLAATGKNNLDGLAFDKDGNIYFSSWGSNSVFRYDDEFKNSPELVSKNHSGPADISINKSNVLAVPNFNSNSVELIDLNTLVSVNETLEEVNDPLILQQTASTLILSESCENIAIYSLSGKFWQSVNYVTSSINIETLSAGVYVIIANTRNKIYHQKFILYR
ncbi:MAG: SMP-30/gluconolactonase/LRE family protein, partial [Bacteroidales bacterium]|nr:SMP-30/gluconolactonase/LRE family protein [Bacteroidales bacterium]